MFLSSVPTLIRMFTDPNYLRFARRVENTLKQDADYGFIKSLKLFFGATRGEKILRFGNSYLISSYLPPLPSQAFMTFLHGAKSKRNLFSDLAFARRSAPLSTYVCVTDRCQYDCIHCSAKQRKPGPELTTSQWIDIMGRLQDLGTAYIGITGGEPMLRDDLEEIVRSVDDRSIVVLSTNGKAFSRKRAHALKQAGLFSLAVSLDSADPDKHNRIRGNRNAFKAGLEAIRISAEAGLYTMVHAVVFKNELSKDNLFKLFKLVKRQGAHEVRLHEPVPCGGLLHTGNGDGIFYSAQDRRRLLRIQFAANRKLKRFPKVNSLPYTEGPDKFGCSAGRLHSYITASGDLCPCDFVPVSFGNVLKENMTELYDRMSLAMGHPKKGCLGIGIAPRLRGKQLPLNPRETLDICRSEATQGYPRFFRDLQTSRNGERGLPLAKG